MKKLLLSLLFVTSPVFAQTGVVFPDSIKDYQKETTSDTTLQLVLFDKNKLKNMHLNQEDLIYDADDLTHKVVSFFNDSDTKSKKSVNKNKKIGNLEKSKGYLLITKYVFLGKDKPYTYIEGEDNEDLKKQVYKESQCKEGICTSHIIMGINYFDNNYNIQPLDIKKFSTIVESKDEKYIRGDDSLSQEGVIKIYYFYGINGTHLPKNKETIKKMIIMSKK